MAKDILEQKLSHYFDGKKASVIQHHIYRDGTTLIEIRDALLDVGVILEEDLEQGIYVGRINGGHRTPRGPIIAVTCSNDSVDIAGIVIREKTKPVLEAINTFEKALDGNPPRPRRHHLGLKLFFLLILFLAALTAFSYYYFFPELVIPAQAETQKYNEAIKEFNSVVPEYNNAAEGVDVTNLRGFVQEAQSLTVQSTGYPSVCISVLGGNRADKIVKDTETVRRMAKELQNEIPVLKTIKNPSADWVASKLEGIDVINGIAAVSSDNDPNEMLGKEGGYTSCTYFSTGLLGKDVIAGETPVQKGVDGGGAVEVYQNLKDAQARCEYLAEFDDTILYSGSYALVGTMVIRTSCLLDEDSQYALTSEIVSSMIDS